MKVQFSGTNVNSNNRFQAKPKQTNYSQSINFEEKIKDPEKIKRIVKGLRIKINFAKERDGQTIPKDVPQLRGRGKK